LIDLVDGKLQQTAEEEPTSETECVLAVTGDELNAKRPPEVSEAA
jgi:hypothetical protein